MNEEELKNIWESYWESKSLRYQNKLVEHYHFLLKIAAAKMHQKHNQFTKDELASMGIKGLYDAIARYDPIRGVKFETYAMPRIRGSVLDEIRSMDWVPRLVRSNNTKLSDLRNILESNAGKKLTDPEMAEAMNISEEDFILFSKGSESPSVNSVDDLNSNQERSVTIDHVEDDKAVFPGEKMLRKELFDKLMGKNFTNDERKIIWLYYLEDVSMKEISTIINLSESRISQMHANILNRLRQKAARNPEYFSDIWNFVGKFKSTVVSE